MNEPDPREVKEAITKFLEAPKTYGEILDWSKGRGYVYNRTVLPRLNDLLEAGVIEKQSRDGVVRLQPKRSHWTASTLATVDAARAVAGFIDADKRDITPAGGPDPTMPPGGARFAYVDQLPHASVTRDIAAHDEARAAGEAVDDSNGTRTIYEEVRTPEFRPEQPTADHTPAAKARRAPAKKPAPIVRDPEGNRKIPEWLLSTLSERTVSVLSRELFQELAAWRGVRPDDVTGSKRLSNRFSKIKRRLEREGLIEFVAVPGFSERRWQITGKGRARVGATTDAAVQEAHEEALKVCASPFAVLRFLSFCFDSAGFIAGDVDLDACAVEINAASARGFIAPQVRAGAGLTMRLTDLGAFVADGFRSAHHGIDLIVGHSDLFRELAELTGRPR